MTDSTKYKTSPKNIKYFAASNEEFSLICKSLSYYLLDNIKNSDYKTADQTARLLFDLIHELEPKECVKE